MTDPVDDEEFLKQRLSEDPSEEFLEAIASTIVDEMSESFPELSLKSRPMDAVLSDFREKKLEEVNSTGQYKRKLNYLQTYLTEEARVESTEDLTSEDVERYEKWRKYESLSREDPLSDATLRDDLYLFREFIRYLVEHRMAPARFEKSVEIPEVDYAEGEGVDEKRLDPEIANAALEYLRKYEYADVEHVSMELLCQSGPRRGGLVGRDVPHFDYEERVLKFETTQATPLKNDESSEREITLYGDVPEIIQDYLENQRPPETDDAGREPLLTKGNGRMSASTLQKIAYKWTRPCMVGLDCPHDRDPQECEAAQTNNAAFKCPSSRAPHHIRTGYITDQKNRGVSAEGIEQRCDVSPRVQDLHYDLPNDTEERERYEDEFREAEDDPDSGFNHD
ncbi:tyrosine-type recombinase/integrase [Halobacterium jilantaiense]|uniref:Site-specific recombinase XerC n=1 Tax=Halobacterium jilantaiense TaxID=355548 RepID=A0A1I0NHT6_9EURY|nr:site-specific integrase [Halobacterium jilantaiense]SEW00689.1 Site-specific recombinase XerC [Halobacterium jilantaiense]